MTGTLTLDLGLDRARTGGERADRPPPRPPRTLDELIAGAWDDLLRHHSVSCPVCTGPMVPRYGSGARPVGGRCRRCGSTLG